MGTQITQFHHRHRHHVHLNVHWNQVLSYDQQSAAPLIGRNVYVIDEPVMRSDMRSIKSVVKEGLKRVDSTSLSLPPFSCLPSPFPAFPSPPLPSPLFLCFPFPSPPFSQLPLEVGPLNTARGLPVGCGTESQRKSNLVHSILEMWHLVASNLLIFLTAVYAFFYLCFCVTVVFL